MRKALLIVLFVIPLISFSQNKKFDKLIREYDVCEYVKNIEVGKPALFWNAVWQNNPRLTKLYEACQKKKKAAIEAQKIVSNSFLTTQMYREHLPIVDSLQFVADTLISRLGVKSLFPDVTMKILSDNEKNAFTYPDGYIYLCAPLVFDFEYEQTFGICAHEAAHFLLQHAMQQAYVTQIKLQKNKIAAGVVASVNMAANAYAQANGATTSDSWESVSEITESLFDEAEANANKFRYKYSREEEIEADLIAYRFLEYMGIDGVHYLNALKNLGYKNDAYYSDESTHPTIKFRVELLEYLTNKEK